MFRVISPESPEQFELIYKLRYEVLRAPWNQPKGSEKDGNEHTSTHAMILSETGECIATGRLQFNSESEGQIRFMAVHEQHRGQQLGRIILNYLETIALEQSRTRIVLQARENAVAFYTAQGYSLEEKTFLLFDRIQHYRMSKVLK